MNSLIYKVVLMGLALTSAAPKKDDVKFELKNFDTGFETGYETPYQGVIATTEQWQKVWEWHKGAPIVNGFVNADGQVPKVDFEKSNVLALFIGASKNVQGFEVANVIDGEDKKGEKQIVIQLVPLTIRGGEMMLTHPYALFEISKVKVTVEVQISSGNQQWKTLAKFMPPKDDKPTNQTRSH